MFLKRFLRRPGISCPTEALTGDNALDAYICDLDSRLLGSKYVRVLTLVEIRDHLEEAKAREIAAGLDERSAAERAVSAMGSAEEHARDQRVSLRRRFLKMAAAWGALTVITTFAWQVALLPEPHPLRSLLFALYVGAIGGMGGAWLVAFRRPTKWIIAARPVRAEAPEQFDVTLPRPIATGMIAAYAWLAVTVVAVMIVCISTLLHPGGTLRAAACGGLLAFNLFSIVAFVLELNRTPRAFHAGAAGFWAKMWSGSEREVAWQAVTAAGYVRWNPHMLFRWHPRRGAFIEYRSMSGRTRRIWFRRDMVNADRLLSMAEERAEHNRRVCEDAGCANVATAS